MLLSRDQVDFYRAKGYLIIEDVLTPEQVEEGRRIVEDFVERSRAVTESDDVFDLEPAHTADRPAIHLSPRSSAFTNTCVVRGFSSRKARCA